jgi:hypothetical protein
MIRSRLAPWVLACQLLLLPLTIHAHQSAVDTHFQMDSTMIAKVQFKNYKLGMWKLNQLHLDIAGIDIKNATADVIINELELKNLKRLGFDVTVTMSKSLMRAPDIRYKKPEDVEMILNDWHQRYPELTELKEVGKSLLGRSIWAIKISLPATLESYPVSTLQKRQHFPLKTFFKF